MTYQRASGKFCHALVLPGNGDYNNDFERCFEVYLQFYLQKAVRTGDIDDLRRHRRQLLTVGLKCILCLCGIYFSSNGTLFPSNIQSFFSFQYSQKNPKPFQSNQPTKTVSFSDDRAEFLCSGLYLDGAIVLFNLTILKH